MKEKNIDLTKIKTYSLHERPSKVSVKDFAAEVKPEKTFSRFIEGLPNILSGKNLKELVKSIISARKRNKPILWMSGAHVIKCGLSPVLIQLAKDGFVSGLALNGAGIIHDFEIAFAGKTSEDVSVHIKDGTFGMAEETGRFINEAITEGDHEGLGIGEAVGRKILQLNCSYSKFSIVAQAYKNKIPLTVHTAIGTDIIYQHPHCNAAAIGSASYRDFLRFTSLVSSLGNGGVLLNFGSAVILPEIFLKAITICRNLGYKVEDFTAANFDMIHQYRPQVNIVMRPVGDKGKGYNFVAQHEIMIPLLAKAILSEKFQK